jgi:hypothetical protein
MKDRGYFGTDQDSRQLRAERAAGQRVGRMIATGLTKAQALAPAEKVIAFYRKNGKAPEPPAGQSIAVASIRFL